MTTATDADPPPGGNWDDDDRAAIMDAEAAGFRQTHPTATDPKAQLFYRRDVGPHHVDVLFAPHRGGFVHRTLVSVGARPIVVSEASGPLPHLVATALEWTT